MRYDNCAPFTFIWDVPILLNVEINGHIIFLLAHDRMGFFYRGRIRKKKRRRSVRRRSYNINPI